MNPAQIHPLDPTSSSSSASPRRVDLHCHSRASNEADEAVLLALQCPESYSKPQDVYRQARQRGMHFVTITDHDCIEGVAELLDRPDVIVGEELTCYFPEDGCKMHVLIWGITRADHDALQAMARDIYKVAEYIEHCRIAHAVAHPVYRQNDKLERWHLERLILLFKGFECLNGAHSTLHRQAFEPMLDALTPQSLQEISWRQELLPRWPEPWKKSRTGGSDDHGLFNIGRTWTEFPPECQTAEQVLTCLREGRCRPGGEAGSSVKLAHNFIGVGVRYFGDRLLSRRRGATSATGMALSALVGEGRRPRKRDLVRLAMGRAAASVGRVARRVARGARGSGASRGGTRMLFDVLGGAAVRRVGQSPSLLSALREGRAPLAEHEAMFGLVTGLDRDVTHGIFQTVGAALKRGELASLFDGLSAVTAHQALLLPYYFALFHQNREREHLGRITGFNRDASAGSLRVGVFTDSLDGSSDPARFTRAIAVRAADLARSFVVHTCSSQPQTSESWRKNFQPLASSTLPWYSDQTLSLPPLAEVLEWADRQQFDVIHIDTAGPMGLAGWMAARMLRVPLVIGYHTDLPGVVSAATSDYRLTLAVQGFTQWFLGQADAVLTRSRAYETRLTAMGVASDRINLVPAEVDLKACAPNPRDEQFWKAAGVREPRRVLFRGRVAAEKNLPILAEAFERVCRTRRDVALIVIGDGPYLHAMQSRLKSLPAYFNPPTAIGAEDHSASNAASDLFVYPSRIDTLAQPVIDAQACGLPVLVSADGAPREMMDEGASGIVLDGADAGAWASAIEHLLDDESLRQRMARTAPHRIARFARPRAFDAYWDALHRAVRRRQERVDADAPVMPPRTPKTAATSQQTMGTVDAKLDPFARECSDLKMGANA